MKVIKSANKSVLADAIDREHTAVTLEGPEQPDQDDYGYESQEAAALYEKMMQKYSKLPEQPKFSSSGKCCIVRPHKYYSLDVIVRRLAFCYL